MAAAHGDPYCSTVCCRLDHKQMTNYEASEHMRHQRYWGKPKFKSDGEDNYGR